MRGESFRGEVAASEQEPTITETVEGLLEGYEGATTLYPEDAQDVEYVQLVEKALQGLDVTALDHTFEGTQKTMFVLDLPNGLSVLGSDMADGVQVLSIVKKESDVRAEYIKAGEGHAADLLEQVQEGDA
jgi:hypothetical protein